MADIQQNIWSSALPRYTASLDAALTLVPEGRRRVEFGSYDGGHGWAYVHTPDDVVGETDDCATEALAVCAAALKAHAHNNARVSDKEGYEHG